MASEKEGRSPDDFSEAQVVAMNALFDFEKAVREGELTINDLTAVMKGAIAEGHGMMSLTLEMAQIALRHAKGA